MGAGAGNRPGYPSDGRCASPGRFCCDVVRPLGGGCAGEAGVAGPVACGGASPVVGGVVVVAEELGEDRRGDGDREREQRARSGCAGGDPELAEPAADPLGPDVRAWLCAWEQPRLCGMFALVAQQRGELWRDCDRVVTEPKSNLAVVGLDIFVAEPDDAGDELTVEQKQRPGDAYLRLDVGAIE